MNYYNYFTEIEEHFVRRRGKHLMVSPMDWSLIATWRDSGVPLHVAIRGIDIAMDGFFARRHASRSKVSTLFYCHDTVMQEYAQHLESHLGEESPQDAAEASGGSAEGGDGPPTQEIIALLKSRADEMKALLGKQSVMKASPEGISRLVDRLEEIIQSLAEREAHPESVERDLGILDNALVEELKGLVPPEKAAEWEKEARQELKVYRKRLDKETYAKILDNYLRGKIRREFDIGELSLFHL